MNLFNKIIILSFLSFALNLNVYAQIDEISKTMAKVTKELADAKEALIVMQNKNSELEKKLVAKDKYINWLTNQLAKNSELNRLLEQNIKAEKDLVKQLEMQKKYFAHKNSQDSLIYTSIIFAQKQDLENLQKNSLSIQNQLIETLLDLREQLIKETFKVSATIEPRWILHTTRDWLTLNEDNSYLVNPRRIIKTKVTYNIGVVPVETPIYRLRLEAISDENQEETLISDDASMKVNNEGRIEHILDFDYSKLRRNWKYRCYLSYEVNLKRIERIYYFGFPR